MTNEEATEKLEEFSHLLKLWEKAPSPETRTQIMRKKNAAERIVHLAGCNKTYTISPPPMIGGLIMPNVDPFEMLFDAPYGMSLIPFALDILDEAIGAIEGGALQRSPRNEPQVAMNIEKHYAFIAMAIDPSDISAADVLDTIKDTASRRGIKAERVDDQQDSTRITDRIIESIRRAEFVICDLTGTKPNVFWEAGFAHALGKLPIYVARAGTQIAFDIKDYPIIFFENMRQLREGLSARLESLAAKATH